MSFLKINYEKYERLISIFIMIYIPLIILFSYMIAITGSLDLPHYEYIMSFITIINLIFIIIAKINKYFKFNIVDIFIILLSICAIISTTFAVNKEVALFGAIGRNEGLLMILCYYSIFLVASYIRNPKYKKQIILVFLISSILQLRDKLYLPYNTGLVGHHNFFGTYCLLVFTLAIGTFIFNSEKKEKYFYITIAAIFFIYLICCKTSSIIIALFFDFVAIIGYIIIIGILKLRKKITKKRLASLSKVFIKLFVVFGIMIIGIRGGTIEKSTSTDEKSTSTNGKNTPVDIVKEAESLKEDLLDISDGKLSDGWGSERGFIWKETLKIVPKYWLHGVGIDCLMYAFDGQPIITPWTNRIVDKTHNEYLQILITEGAFSVTLYIILLFYVFFKTLKNIFKNEVLDKSVYIPLFLAFIGYAIQAFANIRVTRVAPFFFIIFGLLVLRQRNQTDEKIC